MSSCRQIVVVSTVILWAAFVLTVAASSQQSQAGSVHKSNERARVLLSREVPPLNSDHLKMTLVEVNYGPGETSAPHSHPCAVVGYVVSGVLRSHVNGEPEKIYNAGESFYEAPGGIHQVSANASTTEPAKLLAYLICDRDAPLSVGLSKTSQQKGSAQ